MFAPTNKSNTGSCSIHFVREVTLHDLVLQHLSDTIRYVQDYEDEFIRAVMDKSVTEQKKETARKRREVSQAERRIIELDTLLQRAFEANVSGKVSDEQFTRLSKSYETEQHTLSDKVQHLHSELDAEQAQAVNVTQFIALVHKYIDIQELTPTIVNEFISRIIIHAPDKSSGHRVQQIDIKYNFVGMLPTVLPNSKTA